MIAYVKSMLVPQKIGDRSATPFTENLFKVDSSTEAELVAVDDVISKILWTKKFINANIFLPRLDKHYVTWNEW